MSMRPSRVQCMLVSFVALAACGGATSGPNPPPPPPPPAPVATVEVTPGTPSAVVGQTVQLTATPKTAAGAAVAGKTITWSSSAEPVASVSANGLVTGVTLGQATITASADGVSGTATVTVTPVQAASCTDCLEVVPNTLLLPAVGAQQQLVAFLVDATGHRTSVTAIFESSNPAVVAVTPAGRATAAAGLGSSRVTARAGTRSSAPVLALVAQPAPGALLVSDTQIEGAITPVDPAAPYKPGYRYRVRLRGAAPVVGQVVLGTGAAPLGGRVVSVANVGGGSVDVVLELLPISGMFAAISVNQQVSLTQAPSAVPAGVTAAFTMEQQPGGDLRFTPRSGTRMVPTNVRVLSRASALNDISFDLGPYSCKAKVEGALSFPMLLDAFSFTLNPNITLDLVVSNGQLQRLVVQGDITPTVASNLLLNAAVKGSLECKVVLRTLILPIGGPIALIIGGQVPLGVGFALEAKAELAGIGYDAFFQSTVTATLGIDCTGACHMVGDLSSNGGGFFKPRLPASFNDLRTELAASLFGFAELQIGNPFLTQLQFDAVEIKAGLQQKAELASEKGQADDPAYASSFKLSPLIEAKTTSDITALANLLNIQFAELSFAPALPTLATSPVGTFTITPATVQPGNATQLGDLATFTVTLNPVTYLGAYAVDGVEIRWLKDNGTGTMVLQPGRPGCTSLAPTASGQTVFTCQTDFLAADAGTQTFYAFVKAKLFGIPVPLPLEIGGNAVATVTVADCPVINGVVNGDLNVSTPAELACAASVTEVRGNLTIGGGVATIGLVDLPLLTRVDGQLLIQSLQSPGVARLSNLATIGSLVVSNSSPGVVTLDLGSLSHTDHIGIAGTRDLTALSLPSLQGGGPIAVFTNLFIRGNLALKTIALGSGAIGEVTIDQNPVLQTVRVGAITATRTSGVQFIDNPALQSLTTGTITSTTSSGGGLSVQRTGLTSLAGIAGADLGRLLFGAPLGEAAALAFANRVVIREFVCSLKPNGSVLKCYFGGPPWLP